MKNRIFFFVILAVLALSVLSCSKESKPTIPNFEEFSPTLWEYTNSLWFDLDYNDSKLGPATAEIWLSVKGEMPSATLKVNNQMINFAYYDTYTEGRVYGGASIELNTTQPVNYEIVNVGGKTYSGIMTLPDEITGNFPSFMENNNYPASWAYAGEDDPQIQVITASAESQDNGPSHYFTKEIPGEQRDYTLLKSMWEALTPLEYFRFQTNAIVYKRAHGDKVLTIGYSYDNYTWYAASQAKAQRIPLNKIQILELIQADLAK